MSFKGLTFGLAYSPDFYLESGDALYTYVDYELELPNEFGLSFHIADQSIDKAMDFNDYSIGVSKSVAGVDLSLTWHDTDLSKSECGSDICESRVVLASMDPNRDPGLTMLYDPRVADFMGLRDTTAVSLTRSVFIYN